MCKVFKNHGFKLTIKANKTSVNFLDVTLNLNDGTHKLFPKPDSTILYIHAESNHPPNIKKQLPLNINRRLSDLSSNKSEFELEYKTYQKPCNRQRSRSMTWFDHVSTVPDLTGLPRDYFDCPTTSNCPSNVQGNDLYQHENRLGLVLDAYSINIATIIDNNIFY